jgi:hypothetical protein
VRREGKQIIKTVENNLAHARVRCSAAAVASTAAAARSASRRRALDDAMASCVSPSIGRRSCFAVRRSNVTKRRMAIR